MTFDEFKSLCDGVAASGAPASSPCPITIGEGDTLATYGEFNRPLVVLKEAVDTPAMVVILQSCSFRYDAGNTLIEKRS